MAHGHPLLNTLRGLVIPEAGSTFTTQSVGPGNARAPVGVLQSGRSMLAWGKQAAPNAGAEGGKIQNHNTRMLNYPAG